MLCAGPTHHIITTQAHVDHLGGVGLFREPGTTYIAQANNLACQADDARIQALRMRTAGIWFDMFGTDAIRIADENPGVPMRQDTPTPDIMFHDRLGLTLDGLRLELIASVGETIDSCIVWLPEHRTALISNLLGPLFPHFPNLNTLRGDRYRSAEAYLATVRRLRELQPEVLVTGHHDPIVGAELIDASLERLHGAVDYVHRQALEGFNAGTDVWTLMRQIELPAHLRVGQGYGKVAWAVRTLWETYVGWFQLTSTTEMYPDSSGAALAELVAAAGVDGDWSAGRGGTGPWRCGCGYPGGRSRGVGVTRGAEGQGGARRRPSVPARPRWRRQLLGERLAPPRTGTPRISLRARPHADCSSFDTCPCRGKDGRNTHLPVEAP